MFICGSLQIRRLYLFHCLPSFRHTYIPYHRRYLLLTYILSVLYSSSFLQPNFHLSFTTNKTPIYFPLPAFIQTYMHSLAPTLFTINIYPSISIQFPFSLAQTCYLLWSTAGKTSLSFPLPSFIYTRTYIQPTSSPQTYILLLTFIFSFSYSVQFSLSSFNLSSTEDKTPPSFPLPVFIHTYIHIRHHDCFSTSINPAFSTVLPFFLSIFCLSSIEDQTPASFALPFFIHTYI